MPFMSSVGIEEMIMITLRLFSKRIVALEKDMLLMIGVHDRHTSVTILQDSSAIRPEAILLSFVVKEMYATTFSKYVGTFSPNELEHWSNAGKQYEAQGDPLAYGHAFEEVLQAKYPNYVQQLPDYEQGERDKDVQ
jgi:hypothetical protein